MTDLAAPPLSQLEQIGASIDAQLDAGAPGAPGAAAPGPEPIDRGAEFAAMLAMAVALATPALPFLPQCYTEPVCKQIGTAFAAVAEKRGWDLAALNSPELALAIVALPPTIQAIALGRELFEERRRMAEAAARPRSPTPVQQPLPTIITPTPH